MIHFLTCLQHAYFGFCLHSKKTKQKNENEKKKEREKKEMK